MASSATLRDVAELAGVSIGTASQALNNRPNVSPETRARVLDAALSVGYQMKDPPPSTETNLSVIGMLTKNDFGLPITANAFYSYVQAGVESECRKLNIGLMYATIIVDQQNRPVTWPTMISEQRIDGLILIGTFIPGTIDRIVRRAEIPVVLVDSYAPNLNFDSVLTDNAQGAASAVHYLIDQGHQHIGLIGSNPDSPPSIAERRSSYLAALKARGIEQAYVQDSFLYMESGYEATKRLLKTSPQVTAIFACNDEVAIGALRAARDLGLDVPRDLSVVGFDNTDMAKNVTPALTTVHVHKTWMGVIGLRHLLDRAQNPDRPKVTTLVSTQLIIRDSVRSLKPQAGSAGKQAD